ALPHFAASGRALNRNAPALLQYGACLIDQKQPAKAAELFLELLRLEPESEMARYDLALSQHLAGQNAEAIETLRPIADRPDASPDVLSLLATAYESTGALDSGIAALRRAAEIAPRD